MRIAHYLIKAPSGIYHFRRRMPVLLQAILGRATVKRSLQTRDVSVARDLALALWRAYDELHQHVRMAYMAGMTKETKLLLERLKKQGAHYRLVTKPDGTFEVEANGPEDHAFHRLKGITYGATPLGYGPGGGWKSWGHFQAKAINAVVGYCSRGCQP